MAAGNGTTGVERTGILKVAGGKMVRVRLREAEGRIESIRFTGDFFLHPEEDIDVLEESMVGVSLEHADLLGTLSSFFRTRELVGASPEDFAMLIVNSVYVSPQR